MILLLVILFSLAVFHWAYESAIAPSLRLGARYRLFRIRDDLRNLAATPGVLLNQTALTFLEESINSKIEHMRDFDFGFVMAFNRRMHADESFRKRVEHRVAVIQDYQDPEFVALLRRFEAVFREINLVNVGGWFIYIVPIAAAAICWGALRNLFVRLSVIPDTDFEELTECESGADPALVQSRRSNA